MNAEPPTHQGPDPLATPGLVRFLLGKTASDSLAAAGKYFVLEAYQSPRPEDAGRFVLLALPVSKETADAAARVAKGTHRAVKVKGGSSSKKQPSNHRTPTPNS
ncbi:MAG: hypothetical protein H7A48_13885 [Akkermansiaceae bacterium]|nr:hypothetical protein [Akkermansiaceae bacterium]MCP5547363.1 hypothetical protein [Akkermansiaceae bacterium]